MAEAHHAQPAVHGRNSFRDKANWKLIGETSMEGYRIRWPRTHSFNPYGIDNVNIVEADGFEFAHYLHNSTHGKTA